MIDAMGTQIVLLEEIQKNQVDYVLVVKKNQGNLYEGVYLYLGEKSRTWKL